MRLQLMVLFLAFGPCSFSQTNKIPPKKYPSLLWEIKGNGLKKPSYLFGTMHLQYNRAFNFNDSVLTKLIQCDAFAMEIHPDSVTRFVHVSVRQTVAFRTIQALLIGAIESATCAPIYSRVSRTAHIGLKL